MSYSVRVIVVDEGVFLAGADRPEVIGEHYLTVGLLTKDQATKFAAALARVFTIRDSMVANLLIGKKGSDK